MLFRVKREDIKSIKMKRAKQFGLLTLMLIFPVFIIWFLKNYGENQFAIPVYHQNAQELSSELCAFPEGQHHIPSFRLTNEREKTLTEGYFDDHITVVNFFYTGCRTNCPEMSRELARVQGNFSDNPRVRLLSVTTDPDIDQPEVLSEYAQKSGARERQWNFATGEKKDIAELIRCGFILPVRLEEGENLDTGHSDRFVLVDSKRRIRGYYSGTDREDVDRLITEMKILLQEENF